MLNVNECVLWTLSIHAGLSLSLSLDNQKLRFAFVFIPLVCVCQGINVQAKIMKPRSAFLISAIVYALITYCIKFKLLISEINKSYISMILKGLFFPDEIEILLILIFLDMEKKTSMLQIDIKYSFFSPA